MLIASTIVLLATALADVDFDGACVETTLAAVPGCAVGCFDIKDVEVAVLGGHRWVVAIGPGGVKTWTESARQWQSVSLPIAGTGAPRCIDLSGDLIAVCLGPQVDLLRWREVDGWTLEASHAPLLAPQFGTSVAIGRDAMGVERVIVGAPRVVTADPNASATILRHDPTGWIVEQVLAPPEFPGSEWSFGQAVALDGSQLAVAAPSPQWVIGGGPGGVILYDRVDGQWAVDEIVMAPEILVMPSDNDRFGERIALSGDTLAATFGRLFGQFTRVAIMHRDDNAWSMTDLLVPESGSNILGFDMEVLGGCPGSPSGEVLLALGSGTASAASLALIGARVCRIVDGVVVELTPLPNPSGYGIDLVTPGVGVTIDAEQGTWWAALAAPADPLGSSVRIVGPDATDCDGDGVPDACAIADNPSLDCDRSGVPDTCELAAGMLVDSNGDGVPDGCQAPVCEAPPALVLAPLRATATMFGDALDADGDTLAVLELAGAAATPRARIFVRDVGSWSLQATLAIPDAAGVASGGLSLSGDTLVTSRPPLASGSGGGIYAYRRLDGVWSTAAFIGNGGHAAGFGDRVASVGGQSGAYVVRVHRFVDGAWILEQSIGAPDLTPTSTIAMDDTWIVTRALASGVASLKVFRRTPAATTNPWSLFQTIAAPLPIALPALYGQALALDGDRLMAGTSAYVQPGQGTGCVDSFEFTGATWVFRQRIAVVDMVEHAGFGARLDLRYPWLVVGSPDDDDAGDNAGAAWLLHQDGATWRAVRRLALADGAPGQSLGDAVAINLVDGAPETFAGAPTATAGIGGGLVAIHRTVLVDCDGGGYDDACEIAFGFLTDLDRDGVPDWCVDQQGFADLDRDGDVDGGDLALLLAAWGTCAACAEDLDANGSVDGGDLSLMLAAWSAQG